MPTTREVGDDQGGEGGKNGDQFGVRPGDGERHAAADGKHHRHDAGADQSIPNAQGQIRRQWAGKNHRRIAQRGGDDDDRRHQPRYDIFGRHC